MPVIKRYPNRKLYNTEAKRYITLEGIAALIRQGQEVQVIDYATGEDLTAITLTQIIFEQEKKRRGFLPQSVLTGLVRAGGETVSTLRRTLASPLDLARQVDEEIERRVQALINRGELGEEQGLRLRDKLLSLRAEEASSPPSLEETVERLLDERGVPRRRDFQQLLDQLDALAARLDELKRDKEPEQSA